MPSPTDDLKIGRAEFVALVAMMFAIVAFSMDAMLPAIPALTAELSPDAPERVPLILTTFFLGLGIGTFLVGPLSDAFGRKQLMIGGSLIYIAAAGLAWSSQSLELMLFARLLQGLGASGPRVVAMAVTRDLFKGREMARIVSFIMMVFALVPGFAPAIGVGLISLMGWQGIYAAFMVFATISTVWMIFRLPETLPVEKRRPIRLSLIWGAVREIFANRTVRLAIVAQTLSMAILIGMLLLVHQIYSDVYDRRDSFAYWFGAAALVSASASWINAVLVVRVGMRRLITWALMAQVAITATFLVFGMTSYAEPYGFAVFLIWQISVFLQAGLTLGNLNAIGMEPMGHIAGVAASIIAGISTMAAALIAAPVTVLFDGTVAPLLAYVLGLAVLGYLTMYAMARVEAAQE